jgi:hypothetical protein
MEAIMSRKLARIKKADVVAWLEITVRHFPAEVRTTAKKPQLRKSVKTFLMHECDKDSYDLNF